MSIWAAATCCNPTLTRRSPHPSDCGMTLSTMPTPEVTEKTYEKGRLGLVHTQVLHPMHCNFVGAWPRITVVCSHTGVSSSGSVRYTSVCCGRKRAVVCLSTSAFAKLLQDGWPLYVTHPRHGKTISIISDNKVVALGVASA